MVGWAAYVYNGLALHRNLDSPVMAIATSYPGHGLPSGPIAYLTSEYPKVSHTFIQREVAGVRANGMDVITCSVRQPSAGDLSGPEEEAAFEDTFYILATAKNPLTLIGAHLGFLVNSPGRYFKALALAWRTSAPGFRALLYQLFYFAEAGILAQHLQREGAVHLHTHFANSGCSVAMLTSEMSGIPFSFMMHGPAEFFETDRWRLDEKVARARFVTCISHFCRSQLMLFSDKAHWQKLHIQHCALDPDFYDRTDNDRPVGKHLLFIGRLSGVKGAPILLEAVAALQADHPDIHLTFVGDGPERPELEAKTDTLGLRDAVTFAGFRSQGEVADYLAETDIFALPSFAEGVPVVLMEAMASRVPVVTTRIAGIAELVENGVSGYLVPPGDVESLVDRLNELLGDSENRGRMGEAGRQMVIAEFNIRTETARLSGLFKAYRSGAVPTDIRAPLPEDANLN